MFIKLILTAVKNHLGQDGEFTILVQVTTVPVIVAMGHSNSLNRAAEEAASSVMLLLKTMLICTSSLIQNRNNKEQDKVSVPIISIM